MRPHTRLILATLFMLTVGGVAAAFLYVQLGPTCQEHLPRMKKSLACKCAGFEYGRISPSSTGHINTVCFGHATDYVTNFTYWADWELIRSDRVKVEVGSQVLLDSAAPQLIRPYAAAFEKFKQGWQRKNAAQLPPQQRVIFSVYTPATGGQNPVKNDVWFGVGEDFLEVQDGLRRLLTPKEKEHLQNLMR